MFASVLQESASLKDDAVLSDILKQMEASRGKGECSVHSAVCSLTSLMPRLIFAERGCPNNVHFASRSLACNVECNLQ